MGVSKRMRKIVLFCVYIWPVWAYISLSLLTREQRISWGECESERERERERAFCCVPTVVRTWYVCMFYVL